MSLPNDAELWDFQQSQSLLLKHLFSSHISLRTRCYKLAPAHALQIAGCSSCIVIERPPPSSIPPLHSDPLLCLVQPMLLLALHPTAQLRYQSTAMRLARVSLITADLCCLAPRPGTTPKRGWVPRHAMWDRADRWEKWPDRQSSRQDTQPCDFRVILESILSNFAICLGGSDGSAELICRLLALLRLYGTSFLERDAGPGCVAQRSRGVSVQALGSRHSINSYCLSLAEKHIQNNILTY